MECTVHIGAVAQVNNGPYGPYIYIYIYIYNLANKFDPGVTQIRVFSAKMCGGKVTSKNSNGSEMIYFD